MKNTTLFLTVFISVFTILAAPLLMAQNLQNGNFSNGPDHWYFTNGNIQTQSSNKAAHVYESPYTFSEVFQYMAVPSGSHYIRFKAKVVSGQGSGLNVAFWEGSNYRNPKRVNVGNDDTSTFVVRLETRGISASDGGLGLYVTGGGPRTFRIDDVQIAPVGSCSPASNRSISGRSGELLTEQYARTAAASALNNAINSAKSNCENKIGTFSSLPTSQFYYSCGRNSQYRYVCSASSRYTCSCPSL